MKKIWAAAGGFTAGFLNGIFGAAGGLAAVPTLRKAGTDEKQAHATSVAVILPISIVSSVLYLSNGFFSFSDVVLFLPGAVGGAFLGAYLLPKLPSHVLRRVFGGFVIWAAYRLFIR